MNKLVFQKTGARSLGAVRRRSVSASLESLIKAQELQAGRLLPLLVEPAINGVNLVSWAKSHRDFIQANLPKHGGILFRNFSVKSTAQFEEFIKAALGEELLDYSYRSTPRSHVKGKIYTSTEYPADQSIPLHNEMAYSRTWPMKICFYCVEVASQGGETPIADSRRVFERIDPEIRDRFAEKQILYVRNYGGGLDLSWQNVFQTSDRSEVAKFCHKNGIEFEWKDGDRLRTRQVCQAVARHPISGEMVWFNQAHLFHISNLAPAVRKKFLTEFKEEDLPRNSYYGDGSPIDIQFLEKIRRAYDQEAIVFPWQQGDILMQDNMLAAHGRMPFVGSRSVVVGMAEESRSDECLF